MMIDFTTMRRAARFKTPTHDEKISMQYTFETDNHRSRAPNFWLQFTKI